jgi:hypothetical protein
MFLGLFLRGGKISVPRARFQRVSPRCIIVVRSVTANVNAGCRRFSLNNKHIAVCAGVFTNINNFSRTFTLAASGIVPLLPNITMLFLVASPIIQFVYDTKLKPSVERVIFPASPDKLPKLPKLNPKTAITFRTPFANPSALAHCPLRSTRHKVRLGKVQCATARSLCEIRPKPIALFGLNHAAPSEAASLTVSPESGRVARQAVRDGE